MLTASRLAARRPRGDRGFSLMELVVAMVCASILGAMTLAWFMGASSVTTSTTNADLGTAQARNVLQSWGKMLQLAGSSTGTDQTGNGIVSLNSTSISFTAYLSNSGACSANTSCSPLSAQTVSLALSSGKLVETIGTSSSVDLSSTTTAAGPNGCLFTAYEDTTSLGCSGLTSTQLADVTSVVLAFTVQTSTGHNRSFQTTATFTFTGAASS